MKEKISWVLMVLSIIILIVEVAESKSQNYVPNCERKKIENLLSGSEVQSLADLPNGLYVARNANWIIQSDDSQFESSQSFISAQSKIACATLSNNEDNQNQDYSTEVPVLFKVHDKQMKQEINKDSVWQFFLVTTKNKVGIWNRVSKLSTLNFKKEDFFNNSKVKIFKSQEVLSEIDLYFLKEEKDLKGKIIRKYLKISYDLLEN